MRAEADNTLICFAVAEEARPFQRRAAGLPGVRVLVTGMGRQNAEAALGAWLAHAQPAQVLGCGFAGALDVALEVGQVLFETEVPSGLRAMLLSAGARKARFWCADRVAVTPEEKRALRKSTGADAVEMESAALRALCANRGIPFATVRVISDAAEDALPLDFNLLMTPDGQLSYGKLAGALACKPMTVLALWQWHKRLRGAASALADVLMRVIST